MTDQLDFEVRLEQRLRVRAAVAVRPFDAGTIAHAAAAAGAYRRPGIARLVVGRRASRWVLVALLALVAVAAGIVVGSLLARRSEPKVYTFRAAPIPVSVAGFHGRQAVSLPGGRVLIVGERTTDAGPAPAAIVYDSTTGSAGPTGAPGTSRALGTATALMDGRVLFVGNTGAPALATTVPPTVGEVYDPVTGSFVQTGPMPSGRYGHTATLLEDGEVLIAGGDEYDSSGTSLRQTTALLFDPRTLSFMPTGSPAGRRIYAAAARLADGRVVISGGLDDQGVLASAEIYDPARGTFSPTGPMVAARAEHTATTLADGRVAMIGGGVIHNGSLDGTALASIDLYDPGTGTFSAAAPLTTDRTGHAATVLPDGRVLIVGGSNIDGSPRVAEVFDPTTGTTSLAGVGLTGRPTAGAVSLPDGRVLVVGGEDASDAGPELWSSSAATPSPVLGRPSRAFTAIASGMALRDRHTATRLPDGRVLIAGGVDAAGGYPLASILVIDPTTGSSTPAGTLTVPRHDPGSAVLPDGRVLIVGGDSAADGGDSAAAQTIPGEIFDPDTGRTSALGSWRLDGSPESSPYGRSRAVVLNDGRILVSLLGRNGGWIAVYDPSAARFEDIQPSPCEGSAPVRLADGRVFVPCVSRGFADDPRAVMVGANGHVEGLAGGGPWSGAAALRDGRALVIARDGHAAVFDPGTGRSSAVGSMGTARDGAELVTLLDGRVLVVGGRLTSDGSPTADVERFDPATGRFTDIGSMISARVGHTVTLLADGRILIVGGALRSPDRSEPEPAPAELFDPMAAP